MLTDAILNNLMTIEVLWPG